MRRALLASLLLLGVAGCRTQHLGAAGEHSVKAEILRLPFMAHAGVGNGGVSCAGLLLRYHRSELDLEAQMRFPSEALGSVTATELRDYLRGRGFSAEILGGDLSSQLPRGVLGYIERGHPVILALEDRFVLAYGFDAAEKLVYLDDPLTGRRELGYEALERAWRPTGRLLLVAAPAPPVSSRP